MLLNAGADINIQDVRMDVVTSDYVTVADVALCFNPSGMVTRL